MSFEMAGMSSGGIQSENGDGRKMMSETEIQKSHHTTILGDLARGSNHLFMTIELIPHPFVPQTSVASGVLEVLLEDFIRLRGQNMCTRTCLPWSPVVFRGLPWTPVLSRGIPWFPVVSRGIPPFELC